MSEHRSGMGIRLILGIAALMVVIAGLKAAQSILIPVLLSAYLAILCFPVVAFLERRKIPPLLAVFGVVLIVMALLAGIGAIVGTSVNRFTESMPRYEKRLTELVESGSQWLLTQGLDVSALKLEELATPGDVMGIVGQMLGGLMSVMSNTVLILLILIFILLEASEFPAKLKAAAGEGELSMERYHRMNTQVQRYLFIKSLVGLSNGVLLGGWLAILGVDFPVLWGLLAFLLNYIPNLGSVIAAVPPILLALVQLGPMEGLLAGAGFLFVNMVIDNAVEPNLMGRQLGLSTLVVLLSLMFWGWVWGTVGMFLSVPLTMILKIMLEHSAEYHWVSVLMDSRPPQEPEGGRGGEKMSALEKTAESIPERESEAGPVAPQMRPSLENPRKSRKKKRP